VDYLIIDNLSAFEHAEAHRRYSLPVVRAFPREWALVYAGPDSGSRREGTSARVETSEDRIGGERAPQPADRGAQAVIPLKRAGRATCA
jgi:hypothetical protein